MPVRIDGSSSTTKMDLRDGKMSLYLRVLWVWPLQPLFNTSSRNLHTVLMYRIVGGTQSAESGYRLEHDGLKLNRFAAAPSIDSLVSRARYIAERDPKLRKQPHAK